MYIYQMIYGIKNDIFILILQSILIFQQYFHNHLSQFDLYLKINFLLFCKFNQIQKLQKKRQKIYQIKRLLQTFILPTHTKIQRKLQFYKVQVLLQNQSKKQIKYIFHYCFFMIQQDNNETIYNCQIHDQAIQCVLNNHNSAFSNPFFCIKCFTQLGISGSQILLIEDIKKHNTNDIMKNFPPLEKTVQEKVNGAKKRFDGYYKKQMDNFFDFAQVLQKQLKQYLDQLEKNISLHFEQIMNKMEQFYIQYQKMSEIQNLQSILNLKDNDTKVAEMNNLLYNITDQKKNNSKKLSELLDELENLVEQISEEKQMEIQQKALQFINSLDLSQMKKNDQKIKQNSNLYEKLNEQKNLHFSTILGSENQLLHAKQLNQSNILINKQSNLANNNYIEIESMTISNQQDEMEIIGKIQFEELKNNEFLNVIRSKNSIEIKNTVNQDAKAFCQLDLKKFKYKISFQYHPIHIGAKFQLGIVSNLSKHKLIEKQFKDNSVQKLELILDNSKNTFTLQNLYERKMQNLKINVSKKNQYLVVQLNYKKESINFISFKQQMIS
ncbi:hypothetical protein ABPG74_012526 [Tetrahymena malaccensis]